jgi:hypothetical protein
VQDVAGGGCFKEIDAAQQSRLAGARGADDRNDFAFLDFEINVAQHGIGAKRFAQVDDFDDVASVTCKRGGSGCVIHACPPHFPRMARLPSPWWTWIMPSGVVCEPMMV